MILLFVASWSVVEKGDRWLIEKNEQDEVRVTAHSKAKPRKLFDTAWDLADQVHYAPNLKHVRILSQTPDQIVAYEQIAIPIIADRDFVVVATKYIDERANLYQMFVKSGEGVPVAPGHVRMNDMRSTWTFEPEESGAAVTLLSYGDPGGQVPHWIVRLASTQGPADFVRAVIKRAEGR